MKDLRIIRLLDVIRSKIDNTIKFVFLSAGQVVEFSYINKNDGKDIICVPTQTACNMGCKFCFLSDIKIPIRNLETDEICALVDVVVSTLGLIKKEKLNHVLLVSYMGCGEPLLNIDNVIEAGRRIQEYMKKDYRVVRFAVASMIPAMSLMETFIDKVKKAGLKMKFHLSLHSADHMVRKGLMPSAEPIEESVDLVEKFVNATGNSAEIHYALIKDINDRDIDAEMLAAILKGRPVSVKFLAHNAKPSIDFEESERVEYFRAKLEEAGIKTEFYRPPGWDVGSSCGQFLMDYYLKYNKKE
ncbi:MAG: radical SAM protein [Patescibacteria group bacterium]|nr:radical SAM protein [Patescibacteria group bacterium]